MEASKYDNTLEALKLTESEYESEVWRLVREIQEKEHIDLTLTPKRQLKEEAKTAVEQLDWFQEFDGATLGAIVEFSETDPADLTRWSIARRADTALRRMAKEAMVLDILDKTRSVKYTTESPDPTETDQ